MPTSPALLDLTPKLRPERDTLLELLRGLSADDWERPTECPEWNVKGIALHVLGDDLSLLTRQRDAAIDSLSVYAKDHPGASFRALLDGFNEQWVTASEFLSNALVVELLRLVGDWSEAFYCQVGLETVAREAVGFFAQSDPSPYWQVIAREYVERFVHQSQIRRAVGAPELGGELVAEAARVIVHVLAAWIRNYAPPQGSSLAIDFGGVGSWTWSRADDGWLVREGTADDAAARIAVAPGQSVAFLSRGIPEDAIEACLTVDGDASLARGAIEIVVALAGTPPPAGAQ